MAHPLDSLATPPPALFPAQAMLTHLDDCLALGFGRLGAEQHGALGSWGRALGGSPLGPRLSEALSALRRSEFLERHFVAVAAARAAVQGASRYGRAARTGRAGAGTPRPDAPPVSASSGPGPAPLLESTRHWLMEMAIAGFRQLEPETLLPFMATLERLQAEPTLFRLSSLLTGFIDELLAALPMSALPTLPGYRWADLWTRALLLAVRRRPRPPPRRCRASCG